MAVHTSLTIRDTVPQTAVEFHAPFAIVRWEFAQAADRFYTVRDTRDGQDGRSFRTLRVARNQARAAARRAASRPVCPDCGSGAERTHFGCEVVA